MLKNFPTLSRQYNLNKKRLKLSCKLNLKCMKNTIKFGIKREALVCLYVKSSFYKTFYTLTSLNGKIILNLRSGDKRLGEFVNKRKRFSNYALTNLLNIFIKFIKRLKISKIGLVFNGLIKHRTFLLKSLRRSKIKISFVKYNTKVPHNGCRLRKPRSGYKF